SAQIAEAAQDGRQVGRCHVLEDELEDVWYPDVRAAMQLLFATLDAKHPAIKDRLDKCECNDQYRDDPEIECVESQHVLGKVHDEPSAKRRDQPQQCRRGVSAQSETFLKKRDHGLKHRDTA